MVHFYRDVWTAVPTGKVKEVASMLKAIHAQEDAEAAKQKARLVIEKLRAMKLAKAAEIVENGIGETLSYYSLPPLGEHLLCKQRVHGAIPCSSTTALALFAHQQPARTPDARVRRQTRVVGAFPYGDSALMLVAARLPHVAYTRWEPNATSRWSRSPRSSSSPDRLLWPPSGGQSKSAPTQQPSSVMNQIESASGRISSSFALPYLRVFPVT